MSLSPSQTTALSSLPKDYYPHGVAIINTLQQLASAIGSYRIEDISILKYSPVIIDVFLLT